MKSSTGYEILLMQMIEKVIRSGRK